MRNDHRPLVLLANDDGHDSAGIRAVRAAISDFADVVICAPATNQSATSHSLTLHRPLRLKEVEPGVFSLDGTPADCIYVALGAGTRVLSRAPDLCISGLNHGLNLGVDTFYSGTVAAAREAVLRGIPAIALSADLRASVEPAAALGARLARALLERPETFEHPALLNVNFPPGDAWRVQPTRLGKRVYSAEVDFRRDNRGAEYLWIGGAHPKHLEGEGTDTEAYDRGIVGVTPLSLDQSDVVCIASVAKVVAALDRAG
jgi:5'-nucleotidase